MSCGEGISLFGAAFSPSSSLWSLGIVFLPKMKNCRMGKHIVRQRAMRTETCSGSPGGVFILFQFFNLFFFLSPLLRHLLFWHLIRKVKLLFLFLVHMYPNHSMENYACIRLYPMTNQRLVPFHLPLLSTYEQHGCGKGSLRHTRDFSGQHIGFLSLGSSTVIQIPPSSGLR